MNEEQLYDLEHSRKALERIATAQERQADALEAIAKAVGDVDHEGLDGVSRPMNIATMLHNISEGVSIWVATH